MKLLSLSISLPAASLLIASCAFQTVDGSNESGTAPASEASQSESELEPLTVLMIVDRSGSMSTDWEGTPKWQVARDAVSHAVVGLEETLTAGALLFPVPESCTVEGITHPDQIDFRRGDQFLAAWEGNTQISSPGGSTPLGEAFRQADHAIERAREDGLLDGRFRVVLVSDGAPNCYSAEEELIETANRWRGAGIDVRVMGLPGSAAAASLLNRIAGEEVVEDPETGDTILPESDSTWASDPDESTGYIQPESSADVEDSFYQIVR